MSDTNNKIITNQSFYGGLSADEAIGTAGSFAYSRALDHRTNPSQLSVLPGPRKISAGVLQDLILNIVQVKSGIRYAYGDQGNVYKIDTANAVTYVNKLPTGSDGMVYRSDSDAIYYATQTDVRRQYPMSGTPAFDQTYGVSKSIGTAAYRTGGTAATTYTVPVTLVDSDPLNYCSFQPDIEPFYSIKVNVVAKGTGNVTLALHDGLNNVLATTTITAANMTTGLVEFVFSSQIRALVKPNARTYHYHLTSTVADTTVACSTANSLNTADFELWAYRLIQTNNGLHPMAIFQQFTLIGNGRYLSVWEPLTDSNPPNAEFQRHRLTFPDGFEVCGIAVTDEFAVIACEKYSTDGTKDFQEGKLFTWDGTAQTYNQVIDVSGGSPEGIRSHENYPYFTVNGTLCAWAGGKNIVKVRTLPNTRTAFNGIVDATRVYPNMMDIKDGLLHFGYPSITNNPVTEHGIYVWGSLDKNYAASLNYAYVPSSMQDLPTGTSLQLGCLRNFGDEMYMSWKDSNGSYGLDIVDNICTPATVAKYRARRFDAGAMYKDKQALKLGLETQALPTGTAITHTYKIDDNAEQSLTDSTAVMGATDKHKVAVIKNTSTGTNFKRIKIGFDLTTTTATTTAPVIYADSLEWEPLQDRRSL